MNKNTLIGLAAAGALLSSLALAQPPGLGDAGHGGDRWQRMGDYLELSEAQQAEWQRILDVQRDEASSRFEEIRIMREEFSRLADLDSPDLMALGQLALDLHRKTETLRVSRQATTEALKVVLTPEQVERFDSLREARDAMRPRYDRHRSRHWEQKDDSDE